MAYLSDIEIAQQCKMLPISEVAKSAGVDEEYLEHYGKYKAKIDLSLLKNSNKNGKLVLVTAITPTPAGEGKTTTTIGIPILTRMRLRGSAGSQFSPNRRDLPRETPI